MTTDDKRRRKDGKAIDQFFDRELMPLAHELRRQGTVMLEVAFDPAAGSYYRQRPLRAMAPADFEWGGADSPEQLEAALRQLWSDPRSQPLTALAPSLARLAGELRRDDEQQGEVSSFVYVMY